MEYIAVVLIVAAVFGVCYLVDKGFTRIFRSQQQHISGKSVRLSKRYGSIGLVLAALGAACLLAGLSQGWIMIAAGAVLVCGGIALVVYYLTFGVFYDSDGFILTTFGKKSKTYTYGEIQTQQLYVSYGNVIVELHLADGRSVQLQSAMTGAYTFLDFAFRRWLEAKGKREEDCPYYNPQQSCWFPTEE